MMCRKKCLTAVFARKFIFMTWIIHADRFPPSLNLLNLLYMFQLNKCCMWEIVIFERPFELLPWYKESNVITYRCERAQGQAFTSSANTWIIWCRLS